MVINAYFDGVARSAPVNRGVTVACFGNCAYVNNLDIVGVGLSLNRVYDVAHCGGVCHNCFLREIVGSGRNHSADMENIVSPVDAFKNIVVIRKVAPNEFYRRVVFKILEFEPVLFAAAVKQHDVELIFSGVKLLKSGKTHVARGAS